MSNMKDLQISFLVLHTHVIFVASLNTSSESWNTKKQNMRISKYPSSSSICLSHDCHDILPQESSLLPVQGVDLHLGGQQGLLLVVQLLAGGGKLLLGLIKLNLRLSLSNFTILVKVMVNSFWCDVKWCDEWWWLWYMTVVIVLMIYIYYDACVSVCLSRKIITSSL